MVSIAIDGPSAAGKSTIARRLATELGYIYVDTGALYRAIGLEALRRGIDTKDKEKVCEILPHIDISIKYINNIQKVYSMNEDVSQQIRLPEMSMAASNVSAYPAVRAFLLELQRKMAQQNNVVMDGRDIGTVVIPNATLKIFLTASSEERAKRRLKEFEEKGIKVEYNALLEEIKQRDYNDSNRKEAPLKQAENAIYIDSTQMTLQDVVDKIKVFLN